MWTTACRRSGYVSYGFDDTRSGSVTCFVDEIDVAYVIWTDEVTGLYGTIYADGGLATLPELFDWWVSYGGQPQ